MSLIVEFAIGDSKGCPVAAATEPGGRVTSVSRASTAGDGPIPEEFTLSTDDGQAEVGVDGVESVGEAQAASVYRFERDPADPCVCAAIEEIAGPVSDVRAEDGTLVVTVRMRDLETVRSVVERLRETFDGVSVRRLTNLADTGEGLSTQTADEELTARQREVLRTAYEMGYFEYPKGANAGEVAESLGISRSTLAEHLAAAEGKVLGSLVETDTVTA